MKTITGIEVIRVRNRVIKSQVMEACKLTEDEYEMFLFESGIEWIKQRIYNDPAVVLAISSEAFFWKWYKNQWFQREDHFLADHVIFIMMPRPDVDKLLKAEWKRAHDVTKITSFPSGPEWDRLVKRVFKA
jgi:hypothetical protein